MRLLFGGVVAKMVQPVRDVKLLAVCHLAVRHQMPNPPASILNVIGWQQTRLMACVVNTGPITVRVARLGLGVGVNVSNTLLGDTR